MPDVHESPYTLGPIARGAIAGADYEERTSARFVDRAASLHHERSDSLTDAEKQVVMRAAAGFAQSLLHHD